MTARREVEPGFDWPRYPRVLVALDETPAGVFALGHAVPYALDQRSQLTLLAVVPNVSFLLAAAGVSPEVMAKQMEKAAADRLRKIAASLPQGSRPTHLPTPPLWRIKAGERLDLADAGYGEIAVRSWGVFERQREKGTIRPGTRFQVSFPGTVSAIDYFFAEEDRPAARDAYHAAVHRAVEMILSVAPAVDLAFQFDLCYELIDLAQGDAHYVPHFPARSYEEKVDHHGSALDELGRGIPDEARLGYHWCYGTWGGWPMTELTDLTHCVRMSNEAVRRTPRRVDYVHMPVVKHPREEFFTPLADLDIGETAVYLGLIHHTDGVAGFRERMELARRYLPAFGVASVCGFGRVPREELPAILQAHRDCAVELQRAEAALGASAP